MSKPLAKYVKRKMASDDPKDTDLTQKQKLGKYYGICRDQLGVTHDFSEGIDYTNQIHKTIRDLISFTDLLEDSNLEHIIFKEVSLEIDDFIIEDALSVKSWMERWKGAHFFAPDLPLSESATAGKKTSTNISWIGYDKKQLRVGFKNGWVYEYDVEPKFYEYMAGSPSKGQFLWNYLRGRAPGRVIDKPWKITPGGVGGSIVPYNKIIGRRMPERQIKRVQKKFGGEAQRGTQLREVSKIRARKAQIKGGESKVPSAGQTALIKKLEKKYKRDFEVLDAIPQTYYCTICKANHYYNSEIGKAHQKQSLLGKAKKEGKTPLPEPKKKKKKGLTPEEKKRKEEERQARGIKKQREPDPREEAIRKLIEQKGYERERAETKISKQLGPSKEEIATKEKQEKQKKVQEKTQHQVKQKQQQLQHSVLKLQILNQRSFKSEALKNILQLFADLIGGKNIFQASRRFRTNYLRIQRDQKIDLQKKSALLGVINRLNDEIQGLSAPQKDFEVSDAEKKDGWEKCVAWMEEKGETDDPEGICFGILKGKKKKPEEEEEEKEKLISYSKNEKVDKQTKEVINWINKQGFEFIITHGEGGEYDLRMDINNRQKSVGIRIFPRGQTVDVSLWRSKDYHSSIKSFRDIALKHAFNYIEEHLGIVVEKEKKQDFIDEIKNIVEDRWITKKGRHIWIKNWYTLEELNIYDPKTGAGIHEIEPWLKIDRSVDLKKERYSVGLLNRTLEKFPLKLKNMINEIRIFNKITDHPSMRKSKGKVPQSYQRVGWDKTYDQLGGVYIPSENNAYLTPNTSLNTIRHELGHAVWYGLSEKERFAFHRIWFDNQQDMYRRAEEVRRKALQYTGVTKESYEHKARAWEYEANDITEFFAESFARYYKARRPTFEWEPTKQKQPYPEVSTFFRRRMKKYEKDD